MGMGTVTVDGKPVALDERIINAGEDAIRAALSVDFPGDVENAEIHVQRPAHVGAPVTAQVVKRGTHKGQGYILPHEMQEVLNVLERAPEYVNPAIALSVEVLRHEAAGDTNFFDDALRKGDVERADRAGEREGRAVQQALEVCSNCPPVHAERTPEGF